MKAFYILCLLLLHHHVRGRVLKKFLPDQPLFERNYGDALYYSSTETENGTAIGGFGIGNDLSYRTEQNLGLATELLTQGSSLENERENSTFARDESPQNSTDSVPETSSSQHPETSKYLSEILGSESNLSNAAEHPSSVSSSTTTELATQTTGRLKNSTTSVSVGPGPAVIPTGQAVNKSSTDGEEPEGVARGKPSSTENYNYTTSSSSSAETLYQKTLALINDTYVLSILIPVAAGVVFACTIMITIATCRCLSRRCRRRRMRRKALPDSVKNLRPSDRARLLAETSDEEF